MGAAEVRGAGVSRVGGPPVVRTGTVGRQPGPGCPSNETFMQVAGEGLSIQADRLRDLLDQSDSLERHFLLFLHALFVQMSQTALANGKAELEERLARWLLMCHDRIEGDRLHLTHEAVALMLGVRRAGVTVATHLLEENRLIRANRGEITILDREGLKERAQGSYGFPEKHRDDVPVDVIVAGSAR